MWSRKPTEIVNAEDTLPGRQDPMPVAERHFVSGTSLRPPFPEGMQNALFAMGCFWGAERAIWEIPGVFTTAAGYVAGSTLNPTYEEVCSGLTGHAEAVFAVYAPDQTTYADLLKIFWEKHDPTQGMRQANDVGTQYRSGIYYYNDEQRVIAEQTKAEYGAALKASGYGSITTEILPASEFYYAEDYHQQYLAKNPTGYCGLAGTGVDFQ